MRESTLRTAVDLLNDEVHSLRRRDVLPDPQHSPAGGPQVTVHLPIALTVALQLRLPVVLISPRSVPMKRTSMPEAAVDKHREPRSWKRDIDPHQSSGKPDCEMLTKAPASPVQRGANRDLRPGVRLAVRLHHRRDLAAGRGRILWVSRPHEPSVSVHAVC